MSEFELIQKLVADLPTSASTVIAAGDDCAGVRPPAEGHLLLLKTDAVVEGVHFTRQDDALQVGHKALARCLSDIAAMGGRPDSALITLGVPDMESTEYVEAVYRGLVATARRYEVAIVGGETVRNPGGLLISVSLTGSVIEERVVRRSGAQEGDAIFVTGELGGSILGHHLKFKPRVAEAAWLVERVPVHAMVDVSDGLNRDLGHILRASQVGATLNEQYLPIRREAKLRAREDAQAKPALWAALTDGEDFELVFTVPAADAVGLKDGWREAFPDTRLSLIGRIDAQAGLRLKQKDGIRSLSNEDGFDHFQ